MTSDTIIVDETEHIGTITLNRPEAMNTFSTALAEDLDGALKDLGPSMTAKPASSPTPVNRQTNTAIIDCDIDRIRYASTDSTKECSSYG